MNGLSKELLSFIREYTFDALEAYCQQRQIGRDVIVDLALHTYLTRQVSGEIAHLHSVIAMQQQHIEELLKTHEQA